MKVRLGVFVAAGLAAAMLSTTALAKSLPMSQCLSQITAFNNSDGGCAQLGSNGLSQVLCGDGGSRVYAYEISWSAMDGGYTCNRTTWAIRRME